jgi:hypothetical protein
MNGRHLRSGAHRYPSPFIQRVFAVFGRQAAYVFIGAVYAASHLLCRFLEGYPCQHRAEAAGQVVTFRAEGYHKQDTLQPST